MTLNQSVPIPEGTMLTVALVVGQNRWMFSTPVTGTSRVPARVGAGASALVIAMPQTVERCMRREFMRVSTTSLNLPEVEVFPLLDQSSVYGAEIAARGLSTRLDDLCREGKPAVFDPSHQILPTVGPMFKARLLNLGGGGAGLLVARGEHGCIDTSRAYWMRIDLRPEVAAPLSLAAKFVHTHLDSEQNTYCGASFEFGATSEHKGFVASQIIRFAEAVQSHAMRSAA